MKILFLVPYPLNEVPSQRFRFEQYFKILIENGAVFKVQSFLSQKGMQRFFREGSILAKIEFLILGLVKRIIILFQARDYNFIFIHRETTPAGPPVFEWIIAKVLRKKIIYDFDDAIWLTDSTSESWIETKLRWRSKVSLICKWSYVVSAGNEYLANYARKVNPHVVVNPTTIDSENLHNRVLHSKKKTQNRIIVGWTGSYSTLKYLKEIEEVLVRLEKKYNHVDFWVIADRPPNIRLDRLYFKKWSLENEISDLAEFDIGVMPLPDDEWTQGKCGFKALQYMALEIPTVASPVGVNTSIIDHGANGFLAKDLNEWESYLSLLIEDEVSRRKFGVAARQRLESNYSVQSNKKRFLSLFS